MNLVVDIFITFQWLVLRYAILNLEVIQAAIALAKQEGLLVSLDLASFEVFYLRCYSESPSPKILFKRLDTQV